MQEPKKSSKSEPVDRTLGNFQVVDGSVVILPPDEESDSSGDDAKTVVKSEGGSINVSVDGDSDPSQVTDDKSELASQESSEEVRKENERRAKEAAVSTQPRKEGDSVVASGTYDDVKESEPKPAVEDGYGDKEQQKTDEEIRQEDAKKQEEMDRVFHEEVLRTLASYDDDGTEEEDYTEVYDEDDRD